MSNIEQARENYRKATEAWDAFKAANPAGTDLLTLPKGKELAAARDRALEELNQAEKDG